MTKSINAAPSAPSLVTTELGNESGEWHGESCSQSESDFLLVCDECNTEREVGHEIWFMRQTTCSQQELVQSMLTLF